MKSLGRMCRVPFLLCPLVWWILGGVAAGQETEAATRQYASAVALQNRGAYNLAADEWLKFITNYQKDPRLPKAYHYLGICYYQDGKPEQAMGTFQIVVGHYPNFELLQTTYLYLGISQYAVAQAGKPDQYARAIETFNSLVTKYPQGENVPDALWHRGECYYAIGKKVEAIQSYTQLIAKYPEHKLIREAMYALGVSQEETGQADAAGKTYDAFLARFATHRLATEVEMRRGDTLLTLGQPAEALKRFTTASAKAGFALADYATLRHADALAQLQRYGAAAELYASLPARFPQSAHLQRAALAGGKCHYLAGNYPDARKWLTQAIQSGGPMMFEATHWLAQSLLKEKQPAAAQAAVDKVLPQAGRSPYLAQLAMDQADSIYEAAERRKETIPLYAAVAAKFPQDPAAPQAAYMASFVSLEQGDPTAALTYATTFLNAHRDHALAPDVMQIAAESNMQLGKFAEAESLYGQLVQKYPGRAEAESWKVRRVVLLFAQKKFAETIAALTPILGQLKLPDVAAEANYLVGASQVELKQYGPAITSLAASLAAQPKWRQADETLLALAQAYRQTKDLEKARLNVERLVAEFPQSRFLDRAHFRLGEYATLRNDFATAAAEFNQVLTQWPQSPLAPHALHELGCAQLNQKNAAVAEATLTAFLDRYPQHVLAARARYARGMARHQLGKFAPAAEDLQAMLSADPSSKDRSDARFLLGLCQVELKQYPAAATAFSGLLKDDPGYSGADKALYQLAWATKLQGGQEAEAVKLFQHLAIAHPQSPLVNESQFNIGEFAYANKDYAAAAKAYYSVHIKDDGSPLAEKAVHKLAWCYYHQQNYANAQKTFAWQRKRYPSGPLAADAAFMEAECLYKQNLFAEALSAYQALAKPSSSEFEALVQLHAGQSAAQLKQWEKAVQWLTRCTQQFPDAQISPEALYELGWAQQNLGKLKEAVTLYEQTIEKTDKVGRANSEVAARAQFMIGEVQFQNKEHAEAVKSFFKVAYGYSYPKWKADATYEAGRCFEVLGQKGQAIKMYQELVEKLPESDKVPLAKQRLAELQPK